MSALLRAALPSALRDQANREVAGSAARDLAAASYIDDAATYGDAAAAAFRAEAEGHLGVAGVRRARAARLRDGAAKAAAMGLDRLAAFGADAALAEELDAQIAEQSVVNAIRESHTPGVSLFGYVSDAESRLLQQKDTLSEMTIGEREKSFADLLTNLQAAGSNFGADEDESEELPAVAADRLTAAVGCYGGDLPNMLGADALERIGAAFQVTAETLKKRLGRKKARLKKVEKELEDLEAQGKKGLRVKFLQFRVQALEKAITRIEDKLKTAGKGIAETNKATANAAVVQKAEAAVATPAAEDDDSEDADDGEMAAVDVFGMTERRAQRLRRRLRRLMQLRDAATGRRRARLCWRIQRLRAKLASAGMLRRSGRVARGGMGPGRGMGLGAGMRPQGPAAQADEGEDEDEAMGGRGGGGGGGGGRGGGMGPRSMQSMMTMPDEGGGGSDRDDADDSEDSDDMGSADRQGFIGFFQRRADALGAAQDEVYGASKFLQSVGKGFQKAGQAIHEEQVRTQRGLAARAEARAPYLPDVQKQRSAVQAERRSLIAILGKRQAAGAEAYRAGRRGAWTPPVSASRTVKGKSGWVYEQRADGSVAIVGAPAGHEGAVGKVLTSGKAYASIVAEIGPFPGGASRRAGRSAAAPAVSAKAAAVARKANKIARVGEQDWTYDYFDDGSIVIVKAPQAHASAVGKRLRGGEAYNAILAKFEPQLTAAVARQQSGTSATVGAASPWKTYGEKLTALQETLEGMLAEGLDPESDEIEELREDLSEAQEEVQVLGPGAKIVPESDDDAIGGRDPGNEDDLDEAFEDAMGEDDDFGDEDDMGDDDAIGGRDPGNEDDLDEAFEDAMGEDDDFGDEDDMGAGDPGDDDEEAMLDELLGDTDDALGEIAS